MLNKEVNAPKNYYVYKPNGQQESLNESSMLI